MPFRDYPCQVCNGLRQIEIGRNEDNANENILFCPLCSGKGVLHVDYKLFTSEYDRFWKRMKGNYGKENK